MERIDKKQQEDIKIRDQLIKNFKDLNKDKNIITTILDAILKGIKGPFLIIPFPLDIINPPTGKDTYI